VLTLPLLKQDGKGVGEVIFSTPPSCRPPPLKILPQKAFFRGIKHCATTFSTPLGLHFSKKPLHKAFYRDEGQHFRSIKGGVEKMLKERKK
jgi:hypothetical protein